MKTDYTVLNKIHYSVMTQFVPNDETEVPHAIYTDSREFDTLAEAVEAAKNYNEVQRSFSNTFGVNVAFVVRESRQVVFLPDEL